jgi:Lipase maturation factor
MSTPPNPLTPAFLRWWAAPAPSGPPGHLLPRWLFLRSLGLIYFSAFYSLVSQIRGLLGPTGLLPARDYLEAVAHSLSGLSRFWYAPTLLWFRSGDHALLALCWIGMAASLLLALNLWPRAMLLICFVLFLSFVAAAQDFSGYQSDGMLLSAGFISLFFAPRGLRPRWGASRPPSRAGLLLLQLLWFSIYFDSGLAKFFGGDPSWRNFTAMDQYYQNGPLPTWIGWYAAQLPHWFHAATVFVILSVELLVVWLLFLPRRFRHICFFIVTPLQIGIILTANYAFLNYIVLAFGFLLLDDKFLLRFLPARWAAPVRENLAQIPAVQKPEPALGLNLTAVSPTPPSQSSSSQTPSSLKAALWPIRLRQYASAAALWLSAFILAWLLYAGVFLICVQAFRFAPLPSAPVTALQPFRVADSYGLFGRMTWARYEIEFQGSNDGVTWTAYPFRYKPQDVREAPGIYAPYQPRFDWNLWFASLDNWRNNPFVLHTEIALLRDNPDVLALFRSNPFSNSPPQRVRAILWQYWFTDLATRRSTGDWWRRKELGLYAPSLARAPNGKIFVSAFPQSLPAPP